MRYQLHALEVAPGSRKRRRRVGRGSGSGRGTYSGRGIKGQRARSGGRKGLKMKGMRSLILSFPKRRGFARPGIPTLEVSLGTLHGRLEDGQTCTPETLRALGLWMKAHRRAKIIMSNRPFDRKGISFQGIAFSTGAARRVRELGGTIQ